MYAKSCFITVVILFCFAGQMSGQEKVECWKRFELAFDQVKKNNPFDVQLSATFTCGGEKKTVHGFYDGNDTYRIRFMPTVPGEWKYVTVSSVSSMNARKGEFIATPVAGDNHGMVVVDGEHDFK